jgi:hypothetical protein
MARSINSPGVEIIETDLSQYQQIGGATTVFIPGFAAQGPTDEILLVSSAAELEQIYGSPTTPAERYFFYSAKEVLNSPATLLTTRLPYGSGSGIGFDTQYSALLYPVASSAGSFQIGAPIHVTFDDIAYNNIIQNNFTWSAITSSLSLSSATPSLVASLSTGNNINAGVVVINNAQVTQNEFLEGYYVSIADNTGFGANTPFNAVNTIIGLTGTDAYYNIPSSRIGFALSGDISTVGTKSISEVIEFIPRFNFNDAYYNDSLVVTVFKVRNSIYEPQILTYTLQESYIGSLNPTKQDSEGRTFSLENKINAGSPNLRILVNPSITETNWSGLSSINPSTNVRTTSNNKSLAPLGVFSPVYKYNRSKEIGGVDLKVERALALIESTETISLDVVIDAGLTTVFANATDTDTYDDSVYVAKETISTENSSLVERWRTLFNTFNSFVQNTRKDCMFIADPLRQIFVNGPNTKVLSVRGNNFSTNIYNPLKNLISTVNSNYSAIYGNWVRQYDNFTDAFYWFPASGYVAAIYARTDQTTQPWIAPAGLNRGVINNIVDLAFNPNQKQRDFLYTISINPIVSFARDGFVVFGQKTLQNKPSAFDRVNVRRLFLTLERATQRALKYFVFEPNTEFTRTRLKNTITPIFELAKNTEGLYDYLIVCDERNNTSDVIDRNELAVDIYIKPVKAAEFILVNFIATRTGQNFQELI